MSDLISRQAAIDAIKKHRQDVFVMMDDCGFLSGLAKAMEIISKLPSAQPEIIRCKDCKWKDENWRRVSVRWLPCMLIRPGDNWFCGCAERRTDETD